MKKSEEQAIAYLKGELSEAERATFEEDLTQSEELREALERSRELLEMLGTANDEANVRLVNSIFLQAIREGASDVHIVPEQAKTSAAQEEVQMRNSSVLYRQDGVLREVMNLTRQQHQPVVDRIKIMAEASLTERRLPQDGRISVRAEGVLYDIRVHILPTITGERVTARILNREKVLIGLDKLGLSSTQMAALKRLVERPYGLIVVAGGPGSGRTTLLYSLLQEVQRVGPQRSSILTVEDPIELALVGISQTAIDPKVGMTVPAVLRCCLRSDPDVVMSSEVGDAESAELVAQMASGNGLVLTTLPTSDAIGTVRRLKELGLASYRIATMLAGAVGIRLVRKVCPNCVTTYLPAPEELRKAGLSPVEDGPFRKGVGCEACQQTGFKGRIGLFEVWEVDAALRQRIAEKSSSETLWRESFGRWGGSLWDDAREKIRQGLTTVEEVNWALFDYPRPRAGLETLLTARYELHDTPGPD